jgi:Flp pilus assembly protein TadG
MRLNRLARQRGGADGWVRRGVAAVELAALAPLLGMIVLGMFELSRGVLAKETLSNAARKGCRTGIQRDKGSNDIFNDVVNIMTDNGYDSTKFNPAPPINPPVGSYIGSVTITVTDPNGNTLTDALGAPAGSSISVQVAIPVSSVSWLSPYYMQATSLESETMIMAKQ